MLVGVKILVIFRSSRMSYLGDRKFYNLPHSKPATQCTVKSAISHLEERLSSSTNEPFNPPRSTMMRAHWETYLSFLCQKTHGCGWWFHLCEMNQRHKKITSRRISELQSVPNGCPQSSNALVSYRDSTELASTEGKTVLLSQSPLNMTWKHVQSSGCENKFWASPVYFSEATVTKGFFWCHLQLKKKTNSLNHFGCFDHLVHTPSI